MRTTLKRGVGRGAELNGTNGHAVFPPAAVSSVVKYRAPDSKRSGLGLFGRILFFTLLARRRARARLGRRGLPLVPRDGLGPEGALPGRDRRRAADQHVTKPGHAAIGLVIGYDQRAGAEFSSESRSDTVMLVRADPATKSVSMLSIPRDLQVPLYCPSQSTPIRTDRINVAYALCGPKGTVDTVKHLTNLPISYLITVNFRGFTQLVDKIGGHLARRRPPLLPRQRRLGRAGLLEHQHPAGVPAPERRECARLRPLPPHRRRLPPHRAPAGVRARDQGAAREDREPRGSSFVRQASSRTTSRSSAI